MLNSILNSITQLIEQYTYYNKFKFTHSINEKEHHPLNIIL